MLVGDCERYVLIVFSMSSVSQWRVQRDVRLCTQMSCRHRMGSDGRSPNSWKRNIVILCLVP